MKILSACLFICLLTFTWRPMDAQRSSRAFSYQNPIVTGIDTNGLRDCQVLRDGKWWYLTGTSFPHWARQEQNGALNKGVALYRSKDLLHWKFRKYIVQRGDPSKWYYLRFWAPEIHKLKGKYYATFNCSNPEMGYPGQHGGYAVADRIEGPYAVVTENKPLVNGNDLTFFEDYDGKVYAFWNQGRNFGIGFAQVDLEKGKLLTTPVSAIHPGKVDFEILPTGDTSQVPGYDGRLINKVSKYHSWDAIGIEGAYVIKKDSMYYLFYSSWTRGYEIGYATAKHITGPWTKNEQNPIYGAQSRQACERNGLPYSGDDTSPFNQVGHNEVFVGPDGRFWLSCHGIRKPAGNVEEKPFLVIDPIAFDSEGRIKINGPTYSRQSVSLNPRQRKKGE